jgi:outer membrane protein TolC
MKESRADYLKFMEQYENSKKDILNSEKTLKNSVQTYQNLIQAQRRYIESIERKMKDEDKQYRQGMLSLRELSRTTTDLANARLTLTRYLTAYHLYYYQRLGLLDGITEQYAAAIPEWLKNEKKEPETR